MPPLNPVAIPVADPMLTFDGVLLAQMPPVVPVLDNVVVAPTHIAGAPVIGAGNVCTVTVAELKQPEPARNMMLVVPADTPVTRPDVAPIVATAGLLLVQDTPPEVEQLSTVLLPSHMFVPPVIAAEGLLTDNTLVL